MSATGQLLLTLAVVVATAMVGGRLAARCGQPPVIGEILGGIALGPSVLGLLDDSLPGRIAPAATHTALNGLADLGVVLFMFLVGLEIRADGGRVRAVLPVALGSVLAPLALGCVTGLLLFPRFGTVEGAPVPHLAFVVFTGIALSVTACPVLARIVQSHGLTGSRVGDVALGAAALTDIAAWTALGVVVALTGTPGRPVWVSVLATTALVVVVLTVVRPLLARLDRRRDLAGSRWLLGAAVAAALVSAVASDAAGIHSIFGPLLLGLVVPRRDALVRRLETALGEVTLVVLLPAFFVLAGLRVDVGTLGGTEIAVAALVVAVAVAGKVGGAAAPALLVGFDRRDALTVGVLMNTRGLTELVMLGIGLELGLLSTQLYTVLVLMALVTTVMTGPLLTALDRYRAGRSGPLPGVRTPPTDLTSGSHP